VKGAEGEPSRAGRGGEAKRPRGAKRRCRTMIVSGDCGWYSAICRLQPSCCRHGPHLLVRVVLVWELFEGIDYARTEGTCRQLL